MLPFHPFFAVEVYWILVSVIYSEIWYFCCWISLVPDLQKRSHQRLRLSGFCTGIHWWMVDFLAQLCRNLGEYQDHIDRRNQECNRDYQQGLFCCHFFSLVWWIAFHFPVFIDKCLQTVWLIKMKTRRGLLLICQTKAIMIYDNG